MAGLNDGAVISASATNDVAKYSEAAKQAARALDQAAEKADESTEVLDEVTAKRKKAARNLAAAEAEFETRKLQLERVLNALTSVRKDIDAADRNTASHRRDEGLVDVAAEAVAVAAGETDNVLLKAASSAIKAGLTGVVGPVLGLLKPISDAVNGRIEEADEVSAEAAARTHTLRLERARLAYQHQAASETYTEALEEEQAARAALAKAEKAETKAVKQRKKDMKAAKSAKAEAAEARKAEKKAKKEAAQAAGNGVNAAREAAASGSRSAAVAGERVRPGNGTITSRYGHRTHPITGVSKLHSGTDFSYGDGNAYAASSGRVEAVTYDGAYGNMVTLSHGGGVQTRYAHLANASVSVGQQITAGQLVGKIGSTGMSTGAHLHFEVLVGGDFINPEGWLAG